MNTCPGCGKSVDNLAAMCTCGEILRGEITNVRGWETETVFRTTGSAEKPNNTKLAVLLVSLVVVGTILALAWPRLLSRSNEPKTLTGAEAPASTASADQTRSDLVPADDLIPPAEEPGARDNVFIFAGEDAPPRQESHNIPVASRNSSTHAPENSSPSTGPNTFDAQLVNSPADAKPTKSTEPEKNNSNCKADATVAAKQPETSLPPIKEQPRSGYILGPRGGCFIVTASGGKKYVDRALCSQTTAAAARQ